MTGLAVGARIREPELGLAQHRVVLVVLPKPNRRLATQKYVQVSTVLRLKLSPSQKRTHIRLNKFPDSYI